MLKNYIWFFLFGIYITLFMYHLMVYLGRKKDKKNLYYSLAVLSFAYVLFAKAIFPFFTFTFDNQNLYKMFEMLFLLSANPLCILAIIVFSFHSFYLKNLKSLLIWGYIPFVSIPFIICFLSFLFTTKYQLIRNIFFLFFVTPFGLFYCVLFLISYYKNLKRNLYRSWHHNLFHGVLVYMIFYSTYPILLFFKTPFFYQVIISNIGFITMALLSAYALTKEFNQEHRELIDLKENLEQKVITRTQELKNAKEEIEKSHEQKINFFINIAHETKTPLTLIKNYLMKYINKKGVDSDLVVIKNNIDKLTHDMVNFMDIEKLEKEIVFYNHDQIINFSMLVENKIYLFNDIAIKKNIVIKSNIENEIFIKIDPFAADRIINNLLDNAIRYTNFGGNIDIILQTKENKIELIVKDNGIGISEEQQKNIFKPYHQISHEKRNVQGIGIGLNIVKKIIDEINGKIEVKSKLDKGSIFTITMNKYYLSDNEIIKKDIVLSLPIDTHRNITFKKIEFEESKHNIFIIEDNFDMLYYLYDNMCSKYNTYFAINGRDALNKINYIPIPDIIISDIMMDEMDGYEFFNELKKNDQFKSIPFIFLTAKTSANDRITGLQQGAVDYISKPFNIDELISKIESIINLQISREKLIKSELGKRIVETIMNDSGKNKDRIYFEKKCRELNITNREKEIILYILQGKEDKEISNELKISFHTIRKHIRNIYEKCSVQNKIELFNILKN